MVNLSTSEYAVESNGQKTGKELHLINKHKYYKFKTSPLEGIQIYVIKLH